MKRYLTIILSITFLYINAQQPLNHPMKFYQDSTGKIFVNLHQPVYFKISSSPDPNSKKFLLTSQTTPKIVNPLYFSREGKITLYTPWAIDPKTKRTKFPKQNVIFYIYVDGTPPKTSIFLSQKPIINNNNYFFKAPLKIFLSAKDNLSGTEQTLFSINSSPFKLFTDTIIINQQNFYTIKFYSVDNVGNVEKINTYKFYIDNTPPKVIAQFKGNYIKNILGPNAKLILSASDTLSGTKKIMYILDLDPPKNYYKPLISTQLIEGKHTLTYWAIDKVGNQSDSITIDFKVDLSPPLIIEDIIGSSFFVGDIQYLSANSKLKLTAIDNIAGVKAIYYTLDGKNWQKYTEPIPFPKTKKLITLKYYAIDSVGNKSQISESETSRSGIFTTYIDLEPPKISYFFSKYFTAKDSIYINHNTKIYLKAYDSQSGLKSITYQIDGDSTHLYTAPFSIKTQGKHKITITATDNVNNFSLKEITVIVDTTPPTITLHPSQNKLQNGNYLKTTKFFISAYDNITGVKYLAVSVDNAPYKPFHTAITNLSKGEHTIKVIAIDYIDNKRLTKFKIVID